MIKLVLEGLDDSAKDIAEQVLETLKTDINRLNAIYGSYIKIYRENKDNENKLLEIVDKISSITIDIPEIFSKSKKNK